MNRNESFDAFEENLKRLLTFSARKPEPVYERELVKSVLEEVRRERCSPPPRYLPR